jgi:hypothetical protein
MGQVYVANPSNTKILYQVNGTAIQPGWPSGPGKPPQFVTTALGVYPQAGCFNFGDNHLTAQFTDQIGSFGFDFPISGVSVDADLLVYVFRGYAMMLDQFGYHISSSGVPVPPPPPA